MPNEFDPPAIVRDAEEFTEAAILKAMKELKRGMILDKRAYGVWLTRLKIKVGYGRWGSTCTKIGLSERTADRWIAKAAQDEPISDDLAVMESQERAFATSDTLSEVAQPNNSATSGTETTSGETSKKQQSTNKPNSEAELCPMCRRKKRVGRSLPSKCPDCLAARQTAKPDPPKPAKEQTKPQTDPADGQSATATGQSETATAPEGLPSAGLETDEPDALDNPPPVAPKPPEPTPDPMAGIPERLRAFFADKAKFEHAAAVAIRTANIFAEVENTTTYSKGNEIGRKWTAYSTYFRSASHDMKTRTPIQPCKVCGGAEEPSTDADMCPGCENKGYQTSEDLL